MSTKSKKTEGKILTVTDETTEETTEMTVVTPAKKPKMKPRGGNSPVIGNNGLMLEPGDNSKYLGFAMQVGEMPHVSLKEPDKVAERLSTYFKMCFDADMKPTVSAMALSLGMSRQTLTAIKNDRPTGSTARIENIPRETAAVIKKAYAYMETLWEDYMQNGKINPVAGIFLGKNNYNYQDRTEYVTTMNTNLDSDYSVEDIRKRYENDSPDSNDS